MQIRIITVTNKINQPHKQLIEDYCKRIGPKWKIQWRLVAGGRGDKQRALAEEAEAISRLLKPGDNIWLLDETGEQLDNVQLAKKFEFAERSGSDLVFIIGGSYGVDEKIKAVCHTKWSLSPLVFPHQIVQILLSEQIYRTQSILAGHPYHHA